VSKKPRTPPPPHPVQAPKRRDAGAKRPGVPGLPSGRKRMYVVAGAAATLIAVVVVVVAVAGGSGGGRSKKLATLMANAGCTIKTVPAFVPKGQGTHVLSLTKKLPWNTDPPSNGQHYPQWAVWDFYRVAVNPRRVVHNEEHGGIILWWGPKVSTATVDKLEALYQQDPVGMVGTPYAHLGSRVAITAWTGDPALYQQKGYYGQGHIATCPSYTAATAKAFTAFRDQYRGHGPEGIPLSSDLPGSGPQSQ
jgi:hypothetical protein